MRYYLGVDGGGTKTEFLWVDEGGRVALNEVLGCSNPNDIGKEAMVDMLVESKAADTLGKYGERDRIEKFESFISSSIASLVSLGISAKCETTFHGKKRYIMICIEEE